MELESEKALTVIAQSLHASILEWKTVVDDENSSDEEIADAEDYLIQLDQVFSLVKRKYEELRKSDRFIVPFSELFNE